MNTRDKLKIFGYEQIEKKTNHLACGVQYEFNECFILTLDKYLSCIPIDNMTNWQHKNIKIFLDFADGLMEQEDKQYEKFNQLDLLLEKIVDILSPEYQAITQLTNGVDEKIKVANLVEALGNLTAINQESKEYFNNTQVLVQQALEDAMKKALIYG